jgi:hypothetical protein
MIRCIIQAHIVCILCFVVDPWCYCFWWSCIRSLTKCGVQVDAVQNCVLLGQELCSKIWGEATAKYWQARTECGFVSASRFGLGSWHEVESPRRPIDNCTFLSSCSECRWGNFLDSKEEPVSRVLFDHLLIEDCNGIARRYPLGCTPILRLMHVYTPAFPVLREYFIVWSIETLVRT